MTAKNSDEHACLFGLIKSLGWSPATRDDEKILQAIEDDQPIDGIYSLNEEGLLDSFFSFLEEANIFSCIKEVSLEGYRRIMVPVVLLLLTYMTKLLIGIPSMNALPALLFSNTALMRIIGFNAHILENGSCRRGEHSRSPDKEPPTPFSAQTLANFVDRFSTAEVEDFFNSTIQALAAFGVFAETVSTIIDATDLETTENCAGCGVVTREKEKVKKGKVVTVKIPTFGFKLVSIIDLETQIPLAVKVVKIQEHEVNFALELLHQAQRNLGEQARIIKFICDRGFLDGQDLYQLDQMGIKFHLPAKSDMIIYDDARRLALAGEGNKQSRINDKGERTTVVGIEGLDSLDSYCAPEEFAHKNRKDFRPHKLNVVVVTCWDDTEYGVDKGVVYLTNDAVDEPFIPFDSYDDRSIIENLLYRETKQGWHLEKSPKRNEQSMTSHAVLTMLTYALVLSYRDYMQEEEQVEERYRSFELGTKRWRRKVYTATRDHAIIFVGDNYGILHLAEFATLMGLMNTKAPAGMQSKEEIYERKGFSPG